MPFDIKQMMDLSGQVALVTGGAGHIGRVICQALSQLGATILVVDLKSSRYLETLESLMRENQAHRFLEADLQCKRSLSALPAQVESLVGQLDVLVNCAAFVGTSELTGWAVPFLEQSEEAWSAAIGLNLTAPFLLCQGFAPMLARRRGRIVNVSSIYGSVGPDLSLYEGTSMQNPAAYGASKAGLVQLTRYLATVLAPHIRVNTISPGGIERGQPSSFQQRYCERTPLGRMGREEDLAGAVAYLASGLSDYVTGQNLFVDGGWTAW